MPGVGSIARALQSVFVKRESSESRKLALGSLMNRCKETGWPQLMIYPGNYFFQLEI
jgi:hypothetical protein